MSKIQSIHINNFKFFCESKPIELNGKNLLLYGENGSGKSSIYNALYTVLEAASKEPDKVKKYFVYPSEEHPESLVNIHAAHDEVGMADSYVEIVEDNGKKYRLAYDHTEVCGGASYIESQRSTDFINYRSLFSFQMFRNSESSDLHDVFEYSVIPYLPCQAYEYRDRTYRTLSDLFKVYAEVEMLREPNPNGKLVIYKRSRSKLYENFEKLEKAINSRLSGLIDYINSQLQDEEHPEEGLLYKLGCSFKAKLTYKPLTHSKTETEIKYKPYKVLLEIVEYEGETVCIKRPNVFLNEAKMSALAFAIRWAILTKRPDDQATPDALRVLVLDDLMISLDMGNREKILRFLLNDERALQYQMLFMTHERTLFECMKNKLVIKYHIGTENEVEKLEQNGWILREMYDHEAEGKHLPVIEPYETSYSKALDHFNGHSGKIDYCACGNALRKGIEEELVRIFESWHVVHDGVMVNAHNKLMIKTLVQIGAREFPIHHISPQVIDDIEQLRSFVLNPSSHYNPESNFYKDELEDAFEAYRVLRKIRTETIVPFDQVLKFDVQCAAGNVHAYEVKIFKEIMANVSPLSMDGEILDLRMQVEVHEVGGKVYPEDRKTLSELYAETIAYLKFAKHEDPIDRSDAIFDVFTWNGKTINKVFADTMEKLRNIE